MLNFVIVAASWLEIGVGILFLLLPQLVTTLLFGAGENGTDPPLARFCGIALIALGIACLPKKSAAQSNSASCLLAFNFAATVLFTTVAVGVGATQHGILIWPAAILHAAITIALLLQMRTTPATAHTH
jgi:hypothetical protein